MKRILYDTISENSLSSIFGIKTVLKGEECNELGINMSILNDSIIRVASTLLESSWNDIYKDIVDFSLKDKYIGRLFSDKKVVRHYITKKLGFKEIKMDKDVYINVANFMINNRKGDFVLLIDIKKNDPYCLIYSDNTIFDNNIQSGYLDLILCSKLISVFAFEDIDINLCKDKSIMDLLNIGFVDNPNMLKSDIDDCAIRCISYLTGKSWDKVYKKLSKTAIKINESNAYNYKRNIFATANTTNYYFEKKGYNIIEIDGDF